MALLITDECISCGACLPECPNEAILKLEVMLSLKGTTSVMDRESAITFMSSPMTDVRSVSAISMNHNAQLCVRSIIAASQTLSIRRRRRSFWNERRR